MLMHLDCGLERRKDADTDHCRQDVAALCPPYFQAEVYVHGDDESADDGSGHEGAGGEVGGGGEGGRMRVGIGGGSSITLLLLLIVVLAFVRARVQQGAGL